MRYQGESVHMANLILTMTNQLKIMQSPLRGNHWLSSYGKTLLTALVEGPSHQIMCSENNMVE